MLTTWIQAVYQFLWGDLLRIPLPGGSSFGVSLLIILLIPTGIYFTIRTRFLPIRLFADMVRALTGKKKAKWQSVDFSDTDRLNCNQSRNGKSGRCSRCRFRRRCRCGILDVDHSDCIGSSTAFIEATLAQLYKEKDPLYGGYRGGPAYYMHHYVAETDRKDNRNMSVLAVLFAISGLICWCRDQSGDQ